MHRTRLVALGAAALIALAGCSTSTSAPSTPPSEDPATAPVTPPASPSPSGDMTNPVLPPIEIDGKQTDVDATVGETLNVVSDGVTSVSTDNAEVLKVSQPMSDGSAEFNAGAAVVGAGTAKLTVKGGSGVLYTVTVTATQ